MGTDVASIFTVRTLELVARTFKTLQYIYYMASLNLKLYNKKQ